MITAIASVTAGITELAEPLRQGECIGERGGIGQRDMLLVVLCLLTLLSEEKLFRWLKWLSLTEVRWSVHG
jgi:hypothetical protein